MTLRYLSLCSGIEAASVAWQPLGWQAIAFAEIEPFPSAVLAHHYPDVPNLGDMTLIDGRQYRGAVDVLVAGTPCQSFSVAGARRGLDDERGNLTLKFLEIANEINPAFIVWENVPGILSMHDNAFGRFLGLLSGEEAELFPSGKRWIDSGLVLGPKRALVWRILNAQYFGVPNIAVDSTLLDILETGTPQQQYFLSARACAGVLRRDGKRGQCFIVSRQEGRMLTMIERHMCWKKQALE